MEAEASPSAPVVVASKLWNVVRVVLFMLKKGITKSKIMVDLHLLVKRVKLAVGKALAGSLMLHHHYAAFTCRSQDSFVSPRDYEFSCSNSPIFPQFHAIIHNNKRKHSNKSYVSNLDAVHKVFLEMLKNPDEKADVAISNSPLPGFGMSPIGRQLRITDSPFPLKEDHDVDLYYIGGFIGSDSLNNYKANICSRIIGMIGEHEIMRVTLIYVGSNG
ncbi:uncharacterized protein G2W53_034849 [Senna tora]|uniref:Uncharacterized protein n=1 Tax=Senna tora TaxID=362788 RepID=A0A834W9Z7_9FABA|nr:uncharacterized protein G2W53_034849 [Senna tora]